MIDPSDVGIAIVTRGDVDLAPVLSSFNGRFAEIQVWDNSREQPASVFGRYLACDRLTTPIVLTVDDDTILPDETVNSLLAAYEPEVVACNVPARFRDRYEDSGLVGFGAIFDRDLPDLAFVRYMRGGGVIDDFFRRCCDLVVTMLCPIVQLDLPYVDCPWAHADNRMWKQPEHLPEREQMREFCRQVALLAREEVV